MARPKGSKNKTAQVSIEQTKDYSARIRILGKVFTSTGVSVSDAISNLKPSGTARGMSVLTVTHGEKTKDRVLPTTFTSRLFSQSKLTREIAIKNTSHLFGI